ncbi:MAG: hypothetical protein AAGC49_13980 [Brevundimonas sp.]
MTSEHDNPRLTTRRRVNTVPAVTALFWATKAMTTAMGESASDFFVRATAPELAVVGGFCAFVLALVLQLRARRYDAWRYWLAVSMVGVFGTMAADVVHVGLGIPYIVSTPAFALFLAAVFATWWRTEGTLSVHEIDTRRRELFYWAAVVGTFALGTAAGDLVAVTFNLGYLASGFVFAALILVPYVGYRTRRMGEVLAFWFAYVLTRPVGASFADWLGQPPSRGGLGLGSGWVALVLAVGIAVAVVAMTVRDRQDAPEAAAVVA